ncbi:MAG: hypothetical protein WCC84_14140 [Candidatus Cybelea sp.]
MIRSLTILSAAALALVVPIVALAAPTGVMRVYHPVPRTSGSMPASSSRGGTAAQEPFRVPFDLNGHPRSQEPDAQTTWAPYRWRGWNPILGSLLYRPVWYQAGCFANGGLAGPEAYSSTPTGTSASATGFTFGSLAGNRSATLFGSSVSDIARVASANDAAATASPLTLQYDASTAPCGSTSTFSF